MREDHWSGASTRWPGLRITQLVLSNAFAGTEHHVALLSRELAALGVQVRLVCGHHNMRLIDEMSGTGVSVCPLRLGKGNLPADWMAAHRVVVGWDPHVVHAHLGSSLLCGALLTWRGHHRLVFTQHFIRPAYREASGAAQIARALAHRVIHRRVARGLAATRLVQTEMVAREGFSRQKTAVVPLGVDVHRLTVHARTEPRDLRSELDLPCDALLLVTPARLEVVKGHNTLLSALPFVIAKHSNAYLLLAGTGSLEAILRAQARGLGISSRVLFLGQRADVPRLLAEAALCILPSYNDSFGLVLLEAMALGTPVVACNAGGPREIVAHGETGLVVPPHDPQAMAESIVALLDQPEYARALGMAGRQLVLDHFSAQRMAQQTLQVYQMAVRR